MVTGTAEAKTFEKTRACFQSMDHGFAIVSPTNQLSPRQILPALAFSRFFAHLPIIRKIVLH